MYGVLREQRGEKGTSPAKRQRTLPGQGSTPHSPPTQLTNNSPPPPPQGCGSGIRHQRPTTIHVGAEPTTVRTRVLRQLLFVASNCLYILGTASAPPSCPTVVVHEAYAYQTKSFPPARPDGPDG